MIVFDTADIHVLATLVDHRVSHAGQTVEEALDYTETYARERFVPGDRTASLLSAIGAVRERVEVRAALDDQLALVSDRRRAMSGR